MAEIGYLQASVTTAGEAAPVPGAAVVIFTQGETPQLLSYQVTDEDGLTRPFPVETPDAWESRQPGAETAGSLHQPFAAVNLAVHHPDYTRVVVQGVQVFPGQLSIQHTVLQPLAAGTAGRPGGAASPGETITYIVNPQDL